MSKEAAIAKASKDLLVASDVVRANLDARELEVVYARMCEHLTLAAVGKRFNVQRERIRQIQNIALMKLRRARLHD